MAGGEVIYEDDSSSKKLNFWLERSNYLLQIQSTRRPMAHDELKYQAFAYVFGQVPSKLDQQEWNLLD